MTFQDNLIFPSYVQFLNSDYFCLNLSDVYINFIINQDNQICEFDGNQINLTFSCSDNGQTTNIYVKSIEIQSELLLPYDINGDNSNQNYQALDLDLIITDTNIIPTFNNFQIYLNGKYLNTYFSNFRFQHNRQNMIRLNYIQRTEITNVVFYDVQLSFATTIKTFYIGNIFIKNCTFEYPQDLAIGKGEQLFISNADSIHIEDSLFKSAYSFYGGAALNVLRGSVFIQNTNFIDCRSTSTGILKLLRTVNVEMNNVKMINGQVNNNAAGIYMGYIEGPVLIKNTLINNSTANGIYGAAIFVLRSDYEMQFINCLFQNNTVSESGGAMYLDGVYSVLIQNTTFQDNRAQSSSGAYIRSSTIINIQNVTFAGNTYIFNDDFSGIAGGLFIDNQFTSQVEETHIILNNILFYNNTSFQAGALQIQNVLGGKYFSIQNIQFNNNNAKLYDGGAFYLNNIQIPVYINSTVFNDNNSKENGGSMLIKKTNNLILDSITINKSTSQLSGGSFYFDGFAKNITLINIQVNDSQSTVNGGFLFIENGMDLFLENIQINNTVAQKVATVYITDGENININGMYIENSKSYKVGGLYLENIKNSLVQNVVIEKCKVEENYGGSYLLQVNNTIFNNITIQQNEASLATGGFTLINSNNNSFNDITVLNNTAVDSGGGITLIKNNNVFFNNFKINENKSDKIGGGIDILDVQNIQFNQGQFLNNEAIQKTGGGIYIDCSTEIQIKDVIFMGNKAVSGGGISIQTITGLVMEKSQFNDNTASQTGGAIFIFASIDIQFKDIIIQKNQALKNGGGITINRSQNIFMLKIVISSNTVLEDGGGLYITDEVNNLNIKSGEISNNIANNRGGGLFVKDIIQINIEQIIFNNNISEQQGGSVFIYNSLVTTILQSSFQNHQQDIQQGSCLYIKESQDLVIKNSKFQNNMSLQQGGAILSKNTDNIFLENNIFYNNTLSNKYLDSLGGSILIDQSKILIFKNNELKNSFSNFQGGCVYLINVVDSTIDSNIFQSCVSDFDKNLPINKKTFEYKLTKGGAMYYEIIDLKDYNENDLSLKMQNNIFESNQASSGGGIFINQNLENQINLLFNNNMFTNNQADLGPIIRILGDINEQQQIQLNKNQDIRNNVALLSKTKIQTGYVTNEKLINKQYANFQLCDAGQHLQEGGQNFCEPCNSNGICEGGYTNIYPKPQYWRFQNQSDEFFYCAIKPESCLGKDQCKQGYTGLLCEQCDIINHYSVSKEGCSKCSNEINQYLSLMTMFMITVLILSNQVYGLSVRIKKRQIQRCLSILFDTCYQKVNQLSGITKIFLQHAQIMFLVAPIQFQIPFEIKTSVEVVGNPHSALSNSLDCLIKINSEDDLETKKYYLTYYGLAITTGTLLFLISMEVLLYLGQIMIKQKKELFQYFQGSVICFFLMIQPGLLQNSFKFIVCRQVGDYFFSSGDSNISCSSDMYSNVLLPINSSIIVLVGLLIPILFSILLLRFKKLDLLKLPHVQRIIGILYMELKQKYYYWELVTIILKITIVALSISFQYQIIIKGCLCCLVLIIYLIMCFKLKPYLTKNVNNLSLLGTVTQSLTIILILCTYQIKQNEDQDQNQVLYYILISFIVIMNVIFFGFAFYLIMLEFKQLMRKISIKYSIGGNRVKKILNEQIYLEKKAKDNWRVLKIGIHHSSKAKRQKINYVQNLKPNNEQMFYDYVSNAFQNRFTIKYLDDVRLDQQYFLASSMHTDQVLIKQFTLDQSSNQLKNTQMLNSNSQQILKQKKILSNHFTLQTELNQLENSQQKLYSPKQNSPDFLNSKKKSILDQPVQSNFAKNQQNVFSIQSSPKNQSGLQSLNESGIDINLLKTPQKNNQQFLFNKPQSRQKNNQEKEIQTGQINKEQNHKSIICMEQNNGDKNDNILFDDITPIFQ